MGGERILPQAAGNRPPVLDSPPNAMPGSLAVSETLGRGLCWTGESGARALLGVTTFARVNLATTLVSSQSLLDSGAGIGVLFGRRPLPAGLFSADHHAHRPMAEQQKAQDPPYPPNVLPYPQPYSPFPPPPPGYPPFFTYPPPADAAHPENGQNPPPPPPYMMAFAPGMVYPYPPPQGARMSPPPASTVFSNRPASLPPAPFLRLPDAHQT